MKCFIIDFVSISFTKFKVHGGGDFALRAVEFLIKNGKKFFIINNTTDFFQEYSIKDLDLKKANIENEFNEIFYFNPLYQGGDNNFFEYKKKYFYIHGLRMLEMPYDSTSHLYFKFPENLKTKIKGIFFKKHYSKTGQNVLESVESAKGEKVILTPSEHSKYMMKSACTLTTEIEVLPPFLSEHDEISNEAIPTTRDYILILNGDRWVKNSYRFLSAFQQLKEQGELSNIDLIVIGKPVFSGDFDNDSIIYLDYVDRPYLEKLMQNCFFLAYPSLNEGFGYPPLDCFKYGKPVLSTSLSSPNILYNGKVVFTNPYSIDEIKSRILYLIDNKEDYTGGTFYSEMLDIISKKWTLIFS
ncbi:glycosyltransferase [Sphingobacterium prati]|uniref:glycosyltransferase n=1 Tax=Sphingobacterium prati TaxID=2737006 RepID=UPI001556A0DF|nr:glycosyltransferase [Sphingobacterium prati]NPE45873.1 glycosyltransferase [Sphingobacterium prati]